MKKAVLLSALIFSFGFADPVNDGVKAYKNGEYQKSANLWQKACDGGVALGCNNLGDLYVDGQGVKQDYQKAVNLFQKACDMGLQLGCDIYRGLNKAGF